MRFDASDPLAIVLAVAMVLAALLPGAALAQELPADWRAHRDELRREYSRLTSSGDPTGLGTLAKRELERTRALPRPDARRGNALEIAVQVHLLQSGSDEAAHRRALDLATELVDIRRGQKPFDAEALAAALLTQGTVYFALDRSADGDRAFEERLGVLRKAYAPSDPRLAQHLSATARTIEEGYGRFERAATLYQEAIRLRAAHADAGGKAQAADLQALGMLQMNQLRDPAAGETSLGRSGEILERLHREAPAADDVTAGLAQVLVLRSGLARGRGASDEALALLERAAQLTFTDPLEARANANTVLIGLAHFWESEGEPNKAIEAQDKLLARLDAVPMGARSDDEKGLRLDVLVGKAKLLLASGGGPDAARRLLALALPALPPDDPARPGALFVLAEVERRAGHADAQLAAYREALRLARQGATEQAILFATNRARDRGGQPGATVGNELLLGQATVLVPGGQFSNDAQVKPEAIEAQAWGAATNPDRLAISGVPEIRDRDRIAAAARRQVAAARTFPNAALVFVHGYNVGFEDAVKRAGQLKRDLGFDGAVVLFAWPSRGQWWRYGTDRTSAEAASARLGELLAWLARETGAEKIHVVAHSMGNRVALPALAAIDGTTRARIGEIVLAAPAVGLSDFEAHVAKLAAAGLTRLTLYASRHDNALRAGFLRELGTTLAGYVAGGVPFLAKGLDTIDVSEGGSATFEFNHDVFAANPAIIDDIRQLLQTGARPPGARLKEITSRSSADGRPYWYYTAPTGKPQ